MRKKYCSVYLRNADNGPSCYYRVIQFIKNLEGEYKINNAMTNKMFRRNLDCDNKYIKIAFQAYFYIIMLFRLTYYLIRDIIFKPEYVIIQRTTLPRYTPFLFEVLLKKVIKRSTLYWDFDDDIFANSEISKGQAKLLSENSNKIIVTSEYLINKLDNKFKYKVLLLPTTDGELNKFNEHKTLEVRKQTFQFEIRLVWVGTAVNLSNLEKVIKELDIAAMRLMKEQNKQLKLIVICNKPLNYKVENLTITNIKWTREGVLNEFTNAHIGIMPLRHSEYALGKAGFKLVQYISTGLPIIASNVGFNKNVVDNNCGILVNDRYNNEEWISAIIQLSTVWNEWSTYSKNAYVQWNSNFSYKANLDTWKMLLHFDS